MYHRPRLKSLNIKLPEENILKNIYDYEIGKDFLDRTQKVVIIN